MLSSLHDVVRVGIDFNKLHDIDQLSQFYKLFINNTHYRLADTLIISCFDYPLQTW